MKGFLNYMLWLCLMALLPLNAHAFDEYGIFAGTTSTDVGTLYGTWNAAYQGMSITLSGSGTKQDPYQISNEWELCYLEDKVNAGNSFKGKYFKLMNDIDLGGKIWYPIGVKSTTPFAGLFDGNDKTISNMSIVLKDADNNNLYSYGLFGYMKGVIRHLNMTNGYVVINRTDGNAAETLMAGLLCGSMTHDMAPEENIFGAVYECSVTGSIGGAVCNNFNDTYIGGIVGVAYNPVSIYKCQADVRMTLQDIRYAGGIVGWSSLLDFSGERTNSLHTPCVAYIFDCVANVNILAELRETSMLHCGGICGMSNGTLVACVANGTIECGVDPMYSSFNTVQPNMIMGGLTGRNGYSIMNCVSTVQLKDGTTVGGLIGRNYNYHGLQVGDVLNSVFCGHIDSPNAEHTHGLVGEQHNDSHAPVNCLFVGTMHGGTNQEPLLPSGSTPNKCYSDRNMYDDGNEWSCYKYTDQFGTATDSWFVSEYECNVGWKSLTTDEVRTYPLTIKDWVIKEDFYPYFEVDANNITTYGDFYDNVIAVARNYFDDDVTATSTPSLYQKYAWLGSVPMNVQNHAFRANFIDTPVSLAIKQQPIDNEGHQKTATYSLSGEEMTISGEHNAQTATPKDNVSGSMMLTITSDDNVSRSICLDVYTRHQWDGKVTKDFDSGDGTEGSPYLIHNARQLMKAFTTNESGQYYRLTKDIWFNENLLTDEGEPKEEAIAWNHKSKRDSLHWKAHLDGNNYLVRGLYSTNAFGLVETMESGASIDNTGFVDCLVWSPESEAMGEGTTDRPLAFLSPSVATGVKIRNSLFHGVLYERRQTGAPNLGGLLHNVASQADSYIEDCVVAFTTQVKDNKYVPSNTLFAATSGGYMELPKFAERVLVLNNTLAFQELIPKASNTATLNCCYPQGYLKTSQDYPYDPDGKTVEEMTNGTFFSGDGYGKWTVKKGRFPMLTSFATTDYGKLIALPVYTDKANRFDNMNYLLDFTPGAASWHTSNSSIIELDTDIRVIEPKSASSAAYLVRSLDGARVITPITTAAEIINGIEFEDEEAKKFCLAHYDTNGDNAVSLSELKTVNLDKFQADMNENDNDSNDNDGELIKRFPEFRYFAGVDGLGTSFQDKDELEMLAFSGKIKTLPDDAFKGTTSMTSFTIPASVTTFGAHPFYNSGLESFEVELDHSVFATDNGLLTNRDKTQLLCWPNGKRGIDVEVPVAAPSSVRGRRAATSQTINYIEIPANVTKIAANAIYKVPGVQAVFLNSADFDYTTVKQRETNAVTPADGISQIRYYVKDATNDVQNDNQNSNDVEETGEGNGHLLNRYMESSYWIGETIDRYWELEVSERSEDNQGRFWATMYIGFDTELPEGLTAYTVKKEESEEVQYSSPTIELHKLGRKVPMMTPVVILAEKAGIYKLFPSKEAKYEELGMGVNLLDGVNRNGLSPYQSDSNVGGCLTLGKNAKGEVGFFIYKGKNTIPAFRAYISAKLFSNQALAISISDDQSTAIKAMDHGQWTKDDSWYDLQGHKIANGQQPTAKGVYIHNGRLIIKK